MPLCIELLLHVYVLVVATTRVLVTQWERNKHHMGDISHSSNGRLVTIIFGGNMRGCHVVVNWFDHVPYTFACEFVFLTRVRHCYVQYECICWFVPWWMSSWPFASTRRAAQCSFLALTPTEDMLRRGARHSQRTGLVRVKQATEDGRERDSHLRDLGPWRGTEWCEECEVWKETDSHGKCFSAAPRGIHEKALRSLELKVVPEEGSFN